MILFLSIAALQHTSAKLIKIFFSYQSSRWKQKEEFFLCNIKKITERWCTFIRFTGRVRRMMIYCNLVCQVDDWQCITKYFFPSWFSIIFSMLLLLLLCAMNFLFGNHSDELSLLLCKLMMEERFKIIRKRAFMLLYLYLHSGTSNLILTGG